MCQRLKVQPSHCPWGGAPSYHMEWYTTSSSRPWNRSRNRPVSADDLDGAIDLDHRQPPPGRSDRVALTGVRLFADQQLLARRLPGGQVDDWRLAGKVAAGVAGRDRHGVWFLSRWFAPG